MNRERDTAPRGKAFGVMRCTHVAGGRVQTLVLSGRWAQRAEAEKARAAIDARLTPQVIVVDAP